MREKGRERARARDTKIDENMKMKMRDETRKISENSTKETGKV